MCDSKIQFTHARTCSKHYGIQSTTYGQQDAVLFCYTQIFKRMLKFRKQIFHNLIDEVLVCSLQFIVCMDVARLFCSDHTFFIPAFCVFGFPRPFQQTRKMIICSNIRRIPVSISKNNCLASVSLSQFDIFKSESVF